jgi:hypothetical protein
MLFWLPVKPWVFDAVITQLIWRMQHVSNDFMMLRIYVEDPQRMTCRRF